MSGESLFAADKPIRGGVPICFPWFGGREGDVAHGFARVTGWELIKTAAAPDGTVTVQLRLPEAPDARRLERVAGRIHRQRFPTR